VEVTIGDELTARATGRSKKEAEQAAARKASLLISDLDKANSAD
jgi:dsRNA-specific ribonuclease